MEKKNKKNTGLIKRKVILRPMATRGLVLICANRIFKEGWLNYSHSSCRDATVLKYLHTSIFIVIFIVIFNKMTGKKNLRSGKTTSV